MSKENGKALSFLQKLGKSLMTPIAVLPAAGLLLRLGQEDVFNIPWMAAAGAAIFGNLALIFAIGIAVGFAEENNGVAGIAAAVGYFVLTKVATSFNESINMGVLAGIVIGIITGILYNKYKDIKLPQFLGFFGGKRFVPIITSGVALVLGLIAGWGWPHIQWALDSLGNNIASAGIFGALIFGILNRLLIPFGLHHVMNTLLWFQFGNFTDATGKLIQGDLWRFFAGDPKAGIYMTGFFPIMMFALPAACFAMIAAAKKENRKAVAGMLAGIAFTSFLTGITEPIEFTFMFLAPVLYGVHAVLTGASMAICEALGVKSGFTFSAGAIDYVLSYGKASKPLLLLVIGLIFAVIYFVVFYFVIKKFNLPTPGREDDIDFNGEKKSDTQIGDQAVEILNGLGGKDNIESIDACITRLRVVVREASRVDEITLKKAGATGVMKMGNKNYQVIVGTIADPLASQIKKLIKK